MFSSTRLNDSPLQKKGNQKRSLSETNGISKTRLSPVHTSTPLPMNNRRCSTLVLTPTRNKRHSSSEVVVSPPKYLNSVLPNMSKFMHNASGPLLASTQYTINLSTYLDSKSPGYVSRIVQYNEERERSPPTHQARYSSPGMFPVVHLYKKNPPVISPRPRRVMVRIAPSDCSRYNSPEHNKLLLEGMMRENHRQGQQNDVGTRSVLDALKEISRKRIHPGEEYDMNGESAKRLRSNCFTGASGDTTFKRPREDSPRTDGSKVIVIDANYASSTSSDLQRERLKKILTIPEEETTEIQIEEPPENKNKEDNVQLINVETQTIIEDPPPPPLAKPVDDAAKPDHVEGKPGHVEGVKSKVTNGIETEEPVRKPRKAPLQIFDEKPLEIMRRNRLAVLLGALTGEEPVLIPKEDKLAKFREETEQEGQATNQEQKDETVSSPLKSILSTGPKSPDGVEKHVTFSPLPSAVTSCNDITASPVSSSLQPPLRFSQSITQTSASVMMPLMSATASEPSKTVSTEEGNLSENRLTLPVNSSLSVASPPSTNFMFGSTNEAPKQPEAPAVSNGDSASGFGSVSGTQLNVNQSASASAASPPASTTSFASFKFGSPQSTTTFASTSDTAVPNTTSGTFFSTSNAAFSGANNSFVAPNTNLSPPKVGGFKFDLSKPSTPAGSNTSLNQTNEAAKPEPAKVLFGDSKPSDSSSSTSGTTIFGQVPAAKGGFSFTSPSVPAQNNPTSTSNVFNKDVAKSSPFGGSVSDTSLPKSSQNPVFKFGSSDSEVKSNVNGPSLVSASAPAPTFAFGAATPSNSATSLATTTSAMSGGFTITSSAAPFVFGSSSGPMFGVSNADSKPAPPSFASPSNTTVPSFGSGTTTTGATFGTGSSTPAFSSKASTTPSFGMPSSSSALTFGSTTTSGFGSTTTFGSSTANSTNNSAFGSGSAVPAFGSSTTTAGSGFEMTAAAPSFGQAPAANTSGFGGNAFSTTSSGTAVSSTPAFGNSGFGNKSAGFSFGGGANATTTASSLFGTSSSTSKPTFGATGGSTSTFSPFGSSTQSMPAFGTATPSFGATTSASTLAFGGSSSNAAPAFGNASSPFATATTTSVGSTPAFGTTNNTPGSIFGANSATNAFGSTPSKPAFGSGASSAFGGNPTTTTTNNSVFGGGNAAASTFSFGAATTSSSGGFGMNTAPTFGVSTTSNSTFGGSSATPAFGASSTFGNSDATFKSGSSFATTPGFGTVSTSTPSFMSSGFGSSGGSTFGNASNAFGSNSAPVFGSNAPSSNSFGGAPASNNVFGSSGFGSGQASAFDSKLGGAPTTNAFSGTTSTFGSAPGGMGFGSSGPAFPSSTPAQNGIFTFGASNTQQQPQQQPSSGGFSFGTVEPPKPNFNFTTAGSVPNFGATPGPPAFGTNPSPAMGANPTGQFTGGGAMFNIGSGSTNSNRPRPVARARRRQER